MGVPSSSNLGAARGSITIDTSQAQQAPAVMAGVAQGITRAMSGVNASVSGTNATLSSMLGVTRGLAGALGITFGAQGVAQLTRFAVSATELATAFDRQSVAARSLAGSQAELNDLLDTYHDVTGGAVDRATALSDVTRLLAIGFADDATELERFTRAVRGISLATGRSQDMVSTQLQIEMLNQTGLRLDQVGLSMEEVRRKASELRAANRELTEEQAYQQAVLETASDKYGALADSIEAQATGVERLRREWRDLRLELGQDLQQPINEAAGALADLLDMWERFRAMNQGFTDDAIRRRGGLTESDWARIGHRTSIGRVAPQSFNSESPIEGAADVKLDWAQGVSDINAQLHSDIIDAERDYGRQRAEAVDNYQRTVTREAQDFALNRQRQEKELADSIADIHGDAARREQRMAEDFARTVADANRDAADRLSDLRETFDRTVAQRRGDSGERVAEWEEERDKAIEENRKASAERLIELEEDYNRQREEAQRDHDLRLKEAAASLDARALWFEQQRFEQENQESAKAHEERVQDEKAKLQEAIDQLNQAHAERLADEQRTLEKSIAQAKEAYDRQVADEKEALAQRISQANEAYARQLADAKAADEQRIADMQEDFAERIRQEDEDRAIRLQRMAQDHQEQLTEMQTAHTERIAQIRRHADQERTQLDEEAKADLLALGVRNNAWKAEQEAKEKWAEDLWTKFWGHLTGTLNGPQPKPEVDPSLNVRRQQLESERAKSLEEIKKYEFGTPEYIELGQRIYAIELELKKLGWTEPTTTTSAMGRIGSTVANANASYASPVAVGGMGGGGRSLSVGQVMIQVYGAPGQSVEQLANLIDQRIVRAFEVVAGSMA